MVRVLPAVPTQPPPCEDDPTLTAPSKATMSTDAPRGRVGAGSVSPRASLISPRNWSLSGSLLRSSAPAGTATPSRGPSFRWMHADAGRLGRRIFGPEFTMKTCSNNPLRWSSYLSGSELIQDVEQKELHSFDLLKRPVLVTVYIQPDITAKESFTCSTMPELRDHIARLAGLFSPNGASSCKSPDAGTSIVEDKIGDASKAVGEGRAGEKNTASVQSSVNRLERSAAGTGNSHTSTSARSSFAEELQSGPTGGSNAGVTCVWKATAVAKNLTQHDERMLDVPPRSHRHSQDEDSFFDVTHGGAENCREMVPPLALDGAGADVLSVAGQVVATQLPSVSMAGVPASGHETAPTFGLTHGHPGILSDFRHLPEQLQPQQLRPPPDRPPVGRWASQPEGWPVSPSIAPPAHPSAGSVVEQSPTVASSVKSDILGSLGLKQQMQSFGRSNSVDNDCPIVLRELQLPAQNIAKCSVADGGAQDPNSAASPITEVEVASLCEALPEALSEAAYEELLEALPASLRDNRAAALAAVRKNGRVMAVVANDLLRDEEFWLDAVSLSEDDLILPGPCFHDLGVIFQYAPEELQLDRAFALEVVRRNAFAMAYVPDALKLDRAFIMDAAAANGLALHHVPAPLREDPEIFLAAIGSNRFLLHSTGFPPDNLSLVHRAIGNDGLVLEFAPLALRGDRETVLCAVAGNGEALEYASMELRGDREIVLKAVSQDAAALRFASNALRADREVVRAALRSHPSALEHAAAELRGDEEIAEEALHQDPSLSRFLPPARASDTHRRDIPRPLGAC